MWNDRFLLHAYEYNACTKLTFFLIPTNLRNSWTDFKGNLLVGNWLMDDNHPPILCYLTQLYAQFLPQYLAKKLIRLFSFCFYLIFV